MFIFIVNTHFTFIYFGAGIRKGRCIRRDSRNYFRAKGKNADFVTVEIKVNQKVIKRFSADGVLFPQIIGTFNWHDGEYVIYRTDMGSGVCAGGSVYVLRFYENQLNSGLSGVLVSPVLTTCLGEYPVFGINFKGKDKFVLSIAQHELDLDNFNKWVENKPPAKKVKIK